MKDKLIGMSYAEYYEEAGLRRANELKEAKPIVNEILKMEPDDKLANDMLEAIEQFNS